MTRSDTPGEGLLPSPDECPPAYNDCMCSCHRTPGILHCVPFPSPSVGSDTAGLPSDCAGLVERVCHEEQMTIWTGEIAGRLSMENYLRDGLSYDDVLGVHAALEDELKRIVQSAFELGEQATAALSCATEAVGDAALPYPPVVVSKDQDGKETRVSVHEWLSGYVTFGIFLGDHRWAEAEIIGKDAYTVARLILAKPSVAALGPRQEMTCFECSGPLNGPYCPACRPVEPPASIAGLLVRLDRGAMGSGVGPLDCREAAAVLRALEPGWQTMDSAPKDGTAILITRTTAFTDEEGWHVVRWDDDWWRVHDGKHDHPLRGPDPETWQPLPARPKTGSDSDGE